MCQLDDERVGNSLFNRRDFLGVASSLVFSATLVGNPTVVEAQSYRLLCSWSGGRNSGQGLVPARGRAAAEVRDIMNAIGFRAPMQVFIGGVQNAGATIINGRMAIIYNRNFLGRLASCNRFAAMTVLGHEVGHHANRDTSWSGRNRHPWSRELGADWVSGLAMRRLGISLTGAQSGIRCSMGVFSPGSRSHPDSERRVRAITEGWYAG